MRTKPAAPRTTFAILTLASTLATRARVGGLALAVAGGLVAAAGTAAAGVTLDGGAPIAAQIGSGSGDPATGSAAPSYPGTGSDSGSATGSAGALTGSAVRALPDALQKLL